MVLANTRLESLVLISTRIEKSVCKSYSLELLETPKDICATTERWNMLKRESGENRKKQIYGTRLNPKYYC